MTAQKQPSKLLNARELAKALGNRRKPATLLEHARNGWIPSMKSGKLVLFDLEQVLEAMRQNGVPK